MNTWAIEANKKREQPGRKEMAEVNITSGDVIKGFLLFISLLAMIFGSIGVLAMHGDFNGVANQWQNKGNQVTPDHLPIQAQYLGYAKATYKYEWGAFNYATGTFSLNVTLCENINDNPVFQPYLTIKTSFGGQASNASFYAFTPYYSINATNGNPMWSYEVEQEFSASDFFQSNYDTVGIEMHVTSEPSATALVKANSNTVIDWRNILDLAVSVAGS